LQTKVEALLTAARAGNHEEIKQILQEIVPEYKPYS